MEWLGEIAHWLGAVPLLWLLALSLAGRRVGQAGWWMASAFAVSFVADSATHVLPHPFVSQIYPVLQAALFLVVMMPRRWAEVLIGAVILAASASIVARQGRGLDIAHHVIAWGSVALVAHRGLWPGILRHTLAWGFGGLAIAWMGYVLWPGWTSWSLLQGVRLLTATGFCWAAFGELEEG